MLWKTCQENGILGTCLLITKGIAVYFAISSQKGAKLFCPALFFKAEKCMRRSFVLNQRQVIKMVFEIPQKVEMIINILEKAGYEAYAVGGCVRDALLGRTPNDWDITTSAKPEQVKALFHRTVDTGIAHGTVTVLLEKEGFEVTTYRVDGEYEDGRHPKEVTFTACLEEDLKRRDFTINAMAYSAEEGLCDPFGGQEDLARGVVRAVGEPLRRFEEDALRILRLYRFAARFGFVIDEATEAAAKQLAAHLDCVSVERIEEELNKLLSAPKPGAYLEPEVLAFVLPELPPDDLSEAREIIDALPAGAEEVTTRWAALLLPLGEDGTRKALKRLKCSNAVIDGVSTLVKEKAPRTPTLSLQAKRLLGKYDLHIVQQLTALWSVLQPERKDEFTALQKEAETLTAQSACCRVSQLAVNGRDLMAAGVAPGPGLRRALEALLEEVITGRLPNKKAELLAFATKFSAS